MLKLVKYYGKFSNLISDSMGCKLHFKYRLYEILVYKQSWIVGTPILQKCKYVDDIFLGNICSDSLFLSQNLVVWLLGFHRKISECCEIFLLIKIFCRIFFINIDSIFVWIDFMFLKISIHSYSKSTIARIYDYLKVL